MTTKTTAVTAAALQRPVFCFLADGTPIYCVTKDGDPLSCWFSLSPTQPGPAEYATSDLAFDVRHLLGLTQGQMPEPEEAAAALQTLTFEAARQLLQREAGHA